MPDFNRVYKLLARLFPPSGPEYLNPDYVSDQVQLVELLHDRFLAIGGRFVAETIRTALALGDNDTNFTEAEAGTIFFPYGLSIGNPDAAARTVSIFLKQASTPDPWGRTTDASDLFLHQFSQAATLQKSITLGVPLTRGVQLAVRHHGMTGGNNRDDTLLAIAIPGEFVKLSDLRGTGATGLSFV